MKIIEKVQNNNQAKFHSNNFISKTSSILLK